jgi:hypothetical protein
MEKLNNLLLLLTTPRLPGLERDTREQKQECRSNRQTQHERESEPQMRTAYLCNCFLMNGLQDAI